MSVACDIRPFQPGDLPVLQRIREAAFRPVFRSFRSIVGDDLALLAFADAELEQAKHLDSLCEPGSGSQVFVAERDDCLIGFVSLTLDHEKKVGEIGLNAVHPDHAGKGIGARLYAFAVERMKESGMRVATVRTGGDPSHAPARRAYEKAGFGPAIESVYLYKLL